MNYFPFLDNIQDTIWSQSVTVNAYRSNARGTHINALPTGYILSDDFIVYSQSRRYWLYIEKSSRCRLLAILPFWPFTRNQMLNITTANIKNWFIYFRNLYTLACRERKHKMRFPAAPTFI